MKFTLKHGEMARLLRAEGEYSGVRKELTRRAGPVLAAAQAAAPVASGAYKASLQTWQTTTDRAVVMVGSSLPYAAGVEAKTGNLARALSAAGGA